MATSSSPRTASDYSKDIARQLEFLKRSAESYDSGFEDEAIRIATVIRVLVHDTEKSHSLLEQMGRKNKTQFFDTSAPVEGQLVTSYMGLAVVDLGGRYTPFLDDFIPGSGTSVNFDAYWNRIVIVDREGQSFSRKDLVLAATNKDGGAHVDPSLNDDYVALTRANSVGWSVGDGQHQVPLSGVELATIRQIGHELIRTLDPSYSTKKMNVQGPVSFSHISIGPSSKGSGVPRVGRNERCPCRSGKKYKRCHGR